MGADDKIDAKADELKGQVKEGVGRATDDRDLEAEGHADQGKGNLKQAGEKVKVTNLLLEQLDYGKLSLSPDRPRRAGLLAQIGLGLLE